MLILSKGKKRKKLKAFICIRYMGATFISSERCRNIFITRCLFYKISIFEIAKKSKSKLLNGLCRICKAERHQKNCWMGYENISLFSNLVVFISFLYFFIYTKKYQNPSVDLVGRHERVLFIFFSFLRHPIAYVSITCVFPPFENIPGRSRRSFRVKRSCKYSPSGRAAKKLVLEYLKCKL